MAYADGITRLGPGGGPRSPVSFAAAAATATITGTASSGLLEAELVAGGQTVIITLTNDTWAAAGTGPIGSTADTQALIDGLDAASSPALGWNDEIRDKEVTTAVARTSNTVATITLTASPLYSIDDLLTETITLTIPAATLITSVIDVTATPTFDVTADAVVVADDTTPAGGWAVQNWYNIYDRDRKEREEERDQVRKEVESIEDGTDSEIARLLHKQIEQDARLEELASLEALVQSTYTDRQAKLAEKYNERVAKAYVRAATQANYSALEAFEREMDQAIEEEEFLLLAMTLLE